MRLLTRIPRRRRYPACMADATTPAPELPEVEPEQYPPFVATEDERKRFRLALGIARQQFGKDEAAVWMAARSLYHSDLPT